MNRLIRNRRHSLRKPTQPPTMYNYQFMLDLVHANRLKDLYTFVTCLEVPKNIKHKASELREVEDSELTKQLSTEFITLVKQVIYNGTPKS
jgi:hypothetical protein